MLHFDAIEIKAELVLGQPFFGQILPAFEKKVKFFFHNFVPVITTAIYNVVCHMTKK